MRCKFLNPAGIGGSAISSARSTGGMGLSDFWLIIGVSPQICQYRKGNFSVTFDRLAPSEGGGDEFIPLDATHVAWIEHVKVYCV